MMSRGRTILVGSEHLRADTYYTGRIAWHIRVVRNENFGGCDEKRLCFFTKLAGMAMVIVCKACH